MSGPSIAIIDSGGANISSVRFALERLGTRPVFTSDAAVIRAATRVILPGVGAAGTAMAYLKQLKLIDCIRGLTQPVLGICLGMQLLYQHSREDDVDCLGIIPGTLEKFEPSSSLRVPHMGWNTTRNESAENGINDPLLSAMPQHPWFYFVHSFFAPLGPATLASSTHGEPFSAIVRRGNFWGVQFHPERSSQSGARLLKNFLELPCN